MRNIKFKYVFIKHDLFFFQIFQLLVSHLYSENFYLFLFQRLRIDENEKKYDTSCETSCDTSCDTLRDNPALDNGQKADTELLALHGFRSEFYAVQISMGIIGKLADVQKKAVFPNKQDMTSLENNIQRSRRTVASYHLY